MRALSSWGPKSVYIRLSERMTHLHIEESTYYIQLFQKSLSEKVHVTISKGFVGGFEITVLSLFFIEILKEWHERPWTMFPSAKAKQQK